MKKYLFVGDLHGDMAAAEHAIDEAVSKNAEIIQVGDWGFLWPEGPPHTVQYLNSYLKSHGVYMRFLDGNHDWHPALRELPEKDGNLASHITYQHRGSLYEDIDGTRFVFLGGAPSIDWRQRKENVTWWSSECIVERDVERALRWANTPVHVLVTHDSAVPPEGLKEISDMAFVYRSEESKANVRRVVKILKPGLQVHGHYHARLTTSIGDTIVEGLGANIGTFPKLCFLWSRSEL